MTDPETDLERELRRTLQQPGPDALVVPDLVERVGAGMARTRRCRRRGTIAAVFASAALVVGVSVVSATTGQTKPVDAADTGRTEALPFPAPPDGSTWVGMNGVVVAVPAGWPVSESPCGAGAAREVIDARRGAGVDCSYDPSEIQTQVRFTTLDEGTRAEDPLCDLSVDGMCNGGLTFEKQNFAIVVLARGPDAIERVDAILTSAMVLPEGWTTVPFGEGATLDDRIDQLERAGFVVNVQAAERIDRFEIAVTPGIGTPVEEGAVIELAPLTENQSLPTQQPTTGPPTEGVTDPGCGGVEVKDTTAVDDEITVTLTNEGTEACDLTGLQVAVTLGGSNLRDQVRANDFTSADTALEAGRAAVVRLATTPGCQFAGYEFTFTLSDDAAVAVLHPGKVGQVCIQPAPTMDLTAVEVTGAAEPADQDDTGDSGDSESRGLTGLELLECPTGEISGTPGGYLAETPDGYPSQEDAVEAWLAGSRFAGQAYEVSDNGKYALILRPDGSAQAYVEFLVGSGFTVHANFACND